jgi:uncharacterized protein YbbC (DUF1343 family)
MVLLLPAAAEVASAQAGRGRLAEPLAPIAAIAAEEVAAGRVPGAVVLVGREGEIVFRGAFGERSLVPERRPMREDTIFDLASLTKVVATTTAVMQLVDAGVLHLDDPVARYWPAFGAHGKQRITVRQLLTHHSGLRPGLAPQASWSGAAGALARVVAESPVADPDTRFLYGDLDFIVLGELVRRISGQPLDVYCTAHVFTPLGMKDTGFRPAAALRDRLAPTTRWGEVHDPTARGMGGVAGHAGLFSTADDLARFAQMLLDGGRAGDARILSAGAVEEVTSPQSPAGSGVRRGLGWDLDSPLASAWRGLLSDRTYGHTGYTGASLWIDRVTRTYVVILANRVHLPDEGDAGPLRRRIAEVVATAIAPVRAAGVETGVDVLAAERFAPLSGKRVGLITNQTGLDSAGRRTVDLLHAADGVELVRLFGPEHGFTGDREGRVGFMRDRTTGLPVISLYGEVERPADPMLDGLDALVFDVQDAGARFYTYVTTMAYAIEAAARRSIPFYVLDRPNPINAAVVQGPVLEDELRSFTGYFPLPVRHGMTVGELARLFNAEYGIGADLRVVAMRHYRRDEWYDQTGLRWVAPSPNLPSLRAATLYPAVAIVEGANVSVGRGTETPFELVGAPWIDAAALATSLSRRNISGVRFEETTFVPRAHPFAGRTCRGVHIVLEDREELDAPALGIEIARALHRLGGRAFRLDATTAMIGARWVVRAIEDDQEPSSIAARWRAALDRFLALRAKYLLY